MLSIRSLFLVLCIVFASSCSTNYVYVVSGDGNAMPISQIEMRGIPFGKPPQVGVMKAASPPAEDPSTIDKTKDALDQQKQRRPAIYILIDQHRTVSPSTDVAIPVSAIPGL